MIGIIIFSILLFALIIFFLVFLVKLILGAIDKDKEKIKKNTVYSIIFFASMIIVTMIDVVFIATTVYQKRNNIVDFAINASENEVKKFSTNVSNALIFTKDNLENNWDNEFVRQLGNISITIKKYEKEKDKDGMLYHFEFILDNKNSENSAIEIDKIFASYYLIVADKDDVLYPLTMDAATKFDVLPKGKVIVKAYVKLESDIQLIYVRLGNSKSEIEQ